MMRAGTLRPDSFINPSLPLYLSLPPALAAGRLAAGRRARRARPRSAARWARLLSAARGRGGRLRARPGRGARGRAAAAWLAAALLALAPGVVNLCHFATPGAVAAAGHRGHRSCARAPLGGRAPAWPLGLVARA